MEELQPVKPASIDPLAAEMLSGLEAFPCARHIVLGGHFALKHYCDFRPTHDVDAWWSSESTEQDRAKVRTAVDSILAELCQRHSLRVHRRRFGDTESWELLRDGLKIFSFQIAARTFQLFPYLSSPWPPLQIETLADNAASKMNALVQRGAPRDFVDVRQLVISALATPAECWQLWQRKNPDIALADARAEVVRHLHEIELRRPLETIDDRSSPRDPGLVPERIFRPLQFMKLDHSVYPDHERPPETLSTPEEKADYLHRVSAQWDYGIVPERETFDLFRQWKEIFDGYPMRHSAAYHSFRSLFGWEAVPGRLLRAGYEIDDLKEGRTDPCAGWI